MVLSDQFFSDRWKKDFRGLFFRDKFQLQEAVLAYFQDKSKDYFFSGFKLYETN